MVKLKLGAIPDDKPVKLTIELPAAVHRDLYPSGENRLVGVNLLFDSSDAFKCVAKDRGVGDHQRG